MSSAGAWQEAGASAPLSASLCGSSGTGVIVASKL